MPPPQTPSNNHAATSNAFVLHHMHCATHGSPHSAILLQSLISLMDVKGEEAADRVKWEEETNLRLLIRNLQQDGVDSAILQQHVQAVYGSRSSVLIDAEVSSPTSSIVFDSAFAAEESDSSPTKKRAKWSCSPMLEQGSCASPSRAEFLSVSE